MYRASHPCQLGQNDTYIQDGQVTRYVSWSLFSSALDNALQPGQTLRFRRRPKLDRPLLPVSLAMLVAVLEEFS